MKLLMWCADMSATVHLQLPLSAAMVQDGTDVTVVGCNSDHRLAPVVPPPWDQLLGRTAAVFGPVP